MIRMANIDDIGSFVKMKISLFKEFKKDTEEYDWDKYSQALKGYYNEGLLNEKVVAFLAEDNGNTIAISIIYFYDICPTLNNLDGKLAMITDMYTVPEYRNKGIGYKLLSNIMEHTKKLGYKKVTLHATDSGRILYEKYGFKDRTGEMSYKFI